MDKYIITTKDIIEKGNTLNEKHSEYKNATDKEKTKKWQEFYLEWQNYRKEVQSYIKTNPIDISDVL